MNYFDASPREIALEAENKRLKAENEYLRNAGHVPRYSLLAEPDTIDVNVMTKHLELAASIEASKKGLCDLHVVSRINPRFGADGLSYGYYISDLELREPRALGAALAFMHEKFVRDLGAKLA